MEHQVPSCLGGHSLPSQSHDTMDRDYDTKGQSCCGHRWAGSQRKDTGRFPAWGRVTRRV